MGWLYSSHFAMLSARLWQSFNRRGCFESPEVLGELLQLLDTPWKPDEHIRSPYALRPPLLAAPVLTDLLVQCGCLFLEQSEKRATLWGIGKCQRLSLDLSRYPFDQHSWLKVLRIGSRGVTGSYLLLTAGGLTWALICLAIDKYPGSPFIGGRLGLATPL